MKYHYFSAALIISLSSCTSYQYVSLKSELDQTTESKHYYYQENVYVDFDFSGANFPMSIFLENIGSEPLYLDLEKTLFLENDVILRNGIPGNTGNISTFIKYEGQVSGVKSSDEYPNILYIPSGEKISMFYDVFGFPYNEVVKLNSTPKKERVEGYNYRVKSLELPKNQSPDYEIDFYFYTDSTHEDGYDVIATFWPDKIYTKNTKPTEFPFRNPNTFHTSQVNEAAQTAGYLTIIGLPLTALVLIPDFEEE
ncbi:hypothetical protein G3O08_09430 [Cryomorpha ignava]|uniref:DUF4249 domain-containing protein n=1 Tax=Cryomorpha ignava TaxID=101383 RepID=A0A7K3WPY3_9FLAO|nr:hypothetical protein [Cryomorpha ignava]NEN23720.1 hypothetical protein [Cryomorpha ignava]